MMARVVAAVVALAAAARAQECATSSTAYCSDLSGELRTAVAAVAATSRSDCDICQNPESYVSANFDACCSAGVTPSSSCREIQIDLAAASTSDARPASIASVDDAALLTIPVSMSQVVTAEHSCSRTCKLYGDPEGVSFCGVYAEFVLCDGRIDDQSSSDTCEQDKDVCESRVDYYGNQCVYLPDVPDADWIDFDTSGSPCQMNLTANPPPVQLMYSRRPLDAEDQGPSYAVYAEIGERGIITTVIIEIDGVNASLSALDCISSNGDWAAWTNAEIVQPYGNYTVQSTETQVVYDFLFDDVLGLRMLCQRMGNGRARWDVDNLYVTDTAEQAALTSSEDGFCVTSEMNMGQATQSEITNFHSLCMAKNSPNLLVCRTISKECTSETYETVVDAWCSSLTPELRPSNCANRLKTQIRRELSGLPSYTTWSNFFCRIISDYDDTLTRECNHKVDNFGFPEVYSESGYTLDTVMAATACDLDASLEVNTDECFAGLQVQVELENGDRETVASVPLARLVCDEPLEFSGADYPQLFVYDVYLVQCGLSDSCNVARGYRPVAAVEVASESVITMTFTEESSETSAVEPLVCSADSSTSDVVESCPTQCCLLENDGAPLCLDVVVSTTAFCDADTAPAGVDCDAVADSSAYVDITIAPLEDSSSAIWVESCCQTCAGWGDPILLPFDSAEKVKWIECDGRNKKCAFNQDVCEGQRDHLGNECVWNETVFELIEEFNSPAVAYFGSPCQVDWEAAEAAGWLSNVTMFENDDFSLRLFTGERSVLTSMELGVATGGYHRFDPAGCFDDASDTAAEAWSSHEGAGSTPLDDGFTVACGSIDMGGLERPCAITHQGSSAFIQFRCIRAELDGIFSGPRLNVQGISEYLPYSVTGGFCYDGSLEAARGASTVNEDGEACGLDEDEVGSHLTLSRLCKDIFNPTCTLSEVEFAVETWCKYTAILELEDKLTCANSIINGSYRNIEDRWRNYFCKQFGNQYSKCRKDYTKFLDAEPTRDLCFASLEELESYGKDPCMAGVSVMNVDTDEEILFIPDHIPPCNNVLRVPASDKYAELFTAKLEFVKCSVKPSECPLYSALPSVFCDPVRSFSVQLEYSSGDLCPDAS